MIHSKLDCSYCQNVAVLRHILKSAKEGVMVITTDDQPLHHEYTRFLSDPIAWMQEWNDKNGKVETERSDITELNRYSVRLYVAGSDRPVSTGMHSDLLRAWENAISGIDTLVNNGMLASPSQGDPP